MKAYKRKKEGAEKSQKILQDKYDFCRPILLKVARKLSERKEDSPEDCPLLPGKYPDLTGFKTSDRFFDVLRTTLMTNFTISMRRFKKFVPQSIENILKELKIPWMDRKIRSQWAYTLTGQVFNRTEKFEFPRENKTSDVNLTSSSSSDYSNEKKHRLQDFSNVKNALLPFLEELRDALPKNVQSGVFFSESPDDAGATLFLPLLKVLEKKVEFYLTPIGSIPFFYCCCCCCCCCCC